MNKNDESRDVISLVDLIAFFVRYRRIFLASIGFWGVVSVVMFAALPAGLVGPLYDRHEYGQMQVYTHQVPSILDGVIRANAHSTITSYGKRPEFIGSLLMEHGVERADRDPEAVGESFLEAGNLRFVQERGPLRVQIWHVDSDIAIEILREILGDASNRVRDAYVAQAQAYMSTLERRFGFSGSGTDGSNIPVGLVERITILDRYLESQVQPYGLDQLEVLTEYQDRRRVASLGLLGLLIFFSVAYGLVKDYAKRIKQDDAEIEKLRAAWNEGRSNKSE